MKTGESLEENKLSHFLREVFRNKSSSSESSSSVQSPRINIFSSSLPFGDFAGWLFGGGGGED